ncbi:MAG: NAD(+) synthase [Planctomycetota bacterium]|jgi:NAD+ synthase (glutamine-hydrolysing)|nr:NAD(+) synthase [Planctomycetota bacterium]
MTPTGFLRATAASTTTSVGNPRFNRIAIQEALEQFTESDLVVFGELCLSGYTCGELFTQSTLLNACRNELVHLVKSIRRHQLVVVGLPWVHESKLLNVAAVLSDRSILGLVPKQHLPTYQEFYEGRWFQSGSGISTKIEMSEFEGHTRFVPLGTDLLFCCENVVVGVEICEDLWVPLPPSSYQSIAGANVLLNLSASNETVGKATYRQRLVAAQSGKCNAAYIYASAGPSESTTDLVFGGHCLIAENGSLLQESKRVGTGLNIRTKEPSQSTQQTPCNHATSDIDIDRLEHDRRVTGTMHQVDQTTAFRRVSFGLEKLQRPLVRWIDPHPFVPKESSALAERCNEVFEIQVAGLAKRVQQLPENLPLVIGVSGGLDSTLALIVAAKMLDALGLEHRRLVGMTMPGFGTSSKTKKNALDLMDLLGLTSEVIDIRPSCVQVLKNLKHHPFGVDCEGKSLDALQHELEQLPDHRRNDLVFENVQARMRTLLLMSRGFVIGTGDLSEGALGWCTYNADHMSMYNVNCSVPKTLVRFLVRYVANAIYDGEIRRVLLDIANTPISPELLPLSREKEIHQSTEASVGPYELHDFFLYHFVRTGATPEKILQLATEAKFDANYSEQEIDRWLKVFIKRFFQAQFKRSCVPDGPKVGTVSLSPRGDWRMPSDADSAAWLLNQ